MLYYLLTRMVLQMRGSFTGGAAQWDVMVDMFFYREPGACGTGGAVEYWRGGWYSGGEAVQGGWRCWMGALCAHQRRARGSESELCVGTERWGGTHAC